MVDLAMGRHGSETCGYYLILSLALMPLIIINGVIGIKTEGNSKMETDKVEIIMGESNELYKREVNKNLEYIFHFYLNKTMHANISLGGRIRIETTTGGTLPVFFNVKHELQTLSWRLPVTSKNSEAKEIIHNSSQILCEEYLREGDIEDSVIRVNVYTSSLTNTSFSLKLILETNTNLVLDENYTVDVKQTSPQVFKYIFDGRTSEMLQLNVISQDAVCMTVSVQNLSCPISDQLSSIQYKGYWQTMTHYGGISIPKTGRIPEAHGYYIVFVVHEDDSICELNLNGTRRDRKKTISFALKKALMTMDYIWAILETILFFAVFCATTFFIDKRISFSIPLGFDSSTVEDIPSGNRDGEAEDEEIPEEKHATESEEEGAVGSSEVSTSSQNQRLRRVTITALEEESDACKTAKDVQVGSVQDGVFSINVAEDVEKRLMRAKSFRFRFSVGGEMHCVAQLAQADDKVRSQQVRAYFWSVLTVSVFYSLPVIQLVLLYLRLFHSTGNQDLCYYNYLCARPWWIFQDFNHVFSNIGYIIFGLTFLALTKSKVQKYREARLKHADLHVYGIPPHFGLLYALGWGLIVEGVLSASYHVCPTKQTIQFDMCFMYIIAALMFLKMYQTRHQDISTSSHVFFGGLAVVTLVALLASIVQSETFWIPLTILYMVVAILGNLRVYYLRDVKFNRSVGRKFKQNLQSHFSRSGRKPKRMIRLVTMVLSVILNLAMAVILNLNRNSVGFNLVAAIMANFLLYIAFYIVMKKMNHEKIYLRVGLYGIAVLVLCGSAVYMFASSVSSWALTPAESRSLNRNCILFGFYDSHDVWHFLSAAGVFFSFLLLLTLDSDVATVPRSKLGVF